MRLRDFVKGLGYDPDDLIVADRLSHLVDFKRRKEFVEALRTDGDFPEGLETSVNGLACDDGGKGHEDLLARYFCSKLKERSGEEIAKLIADSVPVVVYLHDVFKGVSMQGGGEGSVAKALKRAYGIYDRVASIAEEAPELIQVKENHKKDKYPASVVSAIFQDVKELFPSNGLKDKLKELNRWVSTRLRSEKPAPAAEAPTIDETTALSLLYMPQRSWFTGSDVQVIAHMRGALYVYLLKGGAKLIRLKNPFFDPTTLKDIRGATEILKVFSFHLSREVFSRMRVREDLLEDVYALRNKRPELATPFVFYTTLESLYLLLPGEVEVETLVEKALDDTLREVLEPFAEGGEEDNEEEVEVSYEVLGEMKLDLSQTTVCEAAKQVNEFFGRVDVPERSFAFTVSYEPVLRTSRELCDKCKVRYAIEEDVLSELDWLHVRGQLLGRKERLCNVCLAVRLAWVRSGESTGRSLDELGEDVVTLVMKIDPHVPKGAKVDFARSVEAKVAEEASSIAKELSELVDGWTSEWERRTKSETSERFKLGTLSPGEFLHQLKATLGGEASERDVDELAKVVDCRKNVWDRTKLAFALYGLKTIRRLDAWGGEEVGELLGKVLNLYKQLNQSRRTTEGSKVPWFEELVRMICDKVETELRVQDSVDRRLAQMVEFYLLSTDLVNRLGKSIDRADWMVLVPPSVFSSVTVLAVRHAAIRKLLEALTPLRLDPLLEYDKPPIVTFLVRMRPEVPIRNVWNLVSGGGIPYCRGCAIALLPLYVGRGVMGVRERVLLSEWTEDSIRDALKIVDELSEEHYLVRSRFRTEPELDGAVLATGRLLK
ncbi:hypothetical protein [Sulfodiicoccus acidiphilus]|uniref:hypothetical protein n=1 Tax=Sulfodiicoccus acidiphilus TaxID=1670455 RepID=UPI000F83B89E|nr:hypothetical protein [Sulfodiicoccus acidiphilus]